MLLQTYSADCSCSLVPPYPNLSGETFICSVAGAIAGQTSVSGDAYVETSFQYSYSHIWRNLGIVIAFWIFFLTVYLIATELNSSTSNTAEVLLLRRGCAARDIQQAVEPVGRGGDWPDPLAAGAARNGQTQKSIFTWCGVVYDIHIKDEPRRLLDNVSGWVKPGTLTALMGVSGAGKTTLLDVLAQRTSVGVITGDRLVNGKPLESSFQRRTGTANEQNGGHWPQMLNIETGYVQQQDVHLETSTVREALRFSAMLRQPKSVPTKEKYNHVEDVIKVCVPTFLKYPNFDQIEDARHGRFL